MEYRFDFGSVFARWSDHAALREELRQLSAVLEQKADALPRSGRLAQEIPLVLHARYLDVELSVAFQAITPTGYRHIRCS